MEMQGQRQLNVTQQQAWEALNDPAILQQCVAGCDKFMASEDSTDAQPKYDVGMNLKIGPVSAKFSGKIELAEVNPPNNYKLNFKGQGGAAGFGSGSSSVSLTPNDQGTLLDYTVNAQVGGKIAQLGQRLIDGVSKSMADDFFSRFDEALKTRYGIVEAGTAESSAQEPALAGAAAGAGSGNTAVSSSGQTNGNANGKSGGLPAWAWFLAAVVLGVVISRLWK
jgi:uncharacterized protein